MVGGSRSITAEVVAGLEHDDVVTVDEIDQSMLVVDAPRPTSGEDVPQRLWFADPAEGVAQDLVEQAVEPLERCLVSGLPVPVVVQAA
jgi:hypothetical protein